MIAGSARAMGLEVRGLMAYHGKRVKAAREAVDKKKALRAG
jgi:hypothetical protein